MHVGHPTARDRLRPSLKSSSGSQASGQPAGRSRHLSAFWRHAGVDQSRKNLNETEPHRPATPARGNQGQPCPGSDRGIGAPGRPTAHRSTSMTWMFTTILHHRSAALDPRSRRKVHSKSFRVAVGEPPNRKVAAGPPNSQPLVSSHRR